MFLLERWLQSATYIRRPLALRPGQVVRWEFEYIRGHLLDGVRQVSIGEGYPSSFSRSAGAQTEATQGRPRSVQQHTLVRL